MKKLAVALISFFAFAAAALAQVPNGGGSPGVPSGAGGQGVGNGFGAYLSALAVDAIGDSRMADMRVSTCNGEDWRLCGFSGTNFLAQAIAQNGYKLQIGVNQASSGCRTDQYLQPTNFAPILRSNSGWLVFGMPAVNNISAIGGSCNIMPGGGGGSFPFTDSLGRSVDLSNVARLAANDIISAADQAIAVGKKVVLTLEPGSAPFGNTAFGVGVGTASIASNVVTVTAMTSGRFAVNQILQGSGITANAFTIAGSAVQNSNLCTPACTGSGGVGTYAVNGTLTFASGTLTGQYSTLAAVYEFNQYLVAYAATKPGLVYLFDPRPAVWNPTGSASTITFKPGLMLDNTTHYGWSGGYVLGASFLQQVPAIAQNIPDLNASSIANVGPGNPRQLINNALFNGSATGGTLTAPCTTSGGNATPPTGWQVTCAATTTVNMSVGADSNGYGNALTIAFTAGAADTATVRNNSPASGLLNLASYYQGNMNVAVANGSSNCTVYAENQINSSTPAQTRSSYAMFPGGTVSGGGSNAGPTTAYAIPLRTIPSTYINTTTVTGFLSFRLNVQFWAAGSCTVTISRATLDRVQTYSPLTKTFSGWLFQRDLDHGNDNSPAFLFKAG